jgi:hypothetical protein
MVGQRKTGVERHEHRVGMIDCEHGADTGGAVGSEERNPGSTDPGSYVQPGRHFRAALHDLLIGQPFGAVVQALTIGP